MQNLTKTLKALSDSNRIRILKMLAAKPLCVCEITDILELATSTVSKHLSILRDAGLIVDDKCGKWVNYQRIEQPANAYAQELLPLLDKWLVDDELVSGDLKKVDVVNRDSICRI